MKKTFIQSTICLPLFCLALAVLAQQKALAAENETLPPRRTMSEADIRSMDSTHLVALYDDMLHNPALWHAGTCWKVEDAIAACRDSQADSNLIALFQKVLKEDEKNKELDRFGGKRIGTKTEAVIRLMAEHGTPRCIDFVVALAASKHAIIRGCVVYSLSRAKLADAQKEELLAKVLHLLEDEDSDVALRSTEDCRGFFAFDQWLASPSLARALVAAYEKADPSKKTKEGFHAKEQVADVIRSYDAHLKEHGELASPQERDRIDSVRQIVKQSRWGKEKHD